MQLGNYPTLTNCFRLLLSDNVDSSARMAVIANKVHSTPLPAAINWDDAETEASKFNQEDLETITIGEQGIPGEFEVSENLYLALNWLCEQI